MAAQSEACPQRAQGYRTPALLSDIHLLDLLELSGSTRAACRLLKISQPTVSRRYRALADDFGLNPELVDSEVCRYGTTTTMRLLRQSCRCHRLEAGVARFGSDLLHHGLLAPLHWLLSTPVRFRSASQWVELVRQGVLDGALVSQVELQESAGLDEADVTLHPVGSLPLALASPPKDCRRQDRPPDAVLVPEPAVASGLRRLLGAQGWTLKTAVSSCITPEHWRQQLLQMGCAMAIGDTAGAPDPWLDGLDRQPLPAACHSRVWLILPRRGDRHGLLQHSLETLRTHPALLGGS